MPVRWIPGALALICVISLAGDARADDKIDYAAAKAHYTAAEKALAARDFATAKREYQAAFDITKDPILFFKLGQAHQGAGECKKAVGFYQRYLAEAKPSQEFIDQTRALIEECEAETAPAGAAEGGASGETTAPPTEEPPAEESAPPPKDEATEPEPVDEPVDETAAETSAELEGEGAPSFLDEDISWQRTAAWTSIGVAAAFATAGAVLGLSASSREEDIENLFAFRDDDGEPATYEGTTQERYDELVDEGERLETLSLVAFGVAGAAAVAAAVFFTLDMTSEDAKSEGAAVVPSVGQDSVGVSAAIRF